MKNNLIDHSPIGKDVISAAYEKLSQEDSASIDRNVNRVILFQKHYARLGKQKIYCLGEFGVLELLVKLGIFLNHMKAAK